MTYIKDKNSVTSKGTAMRFNKGKLRYDLIHSKSQQDLVKALTSLSDLDLLKFNNDTIKIEILSLIKERVDLFKLGHDYDTCTGLLHVSYIAAYLHILNGLEYKKISINRRLSSTSNGYELLIPESTQDLVKVLTYGAEKYTLYDEEDAHITYDGSMNWRNGLSWMSVIASFERHLKDYEMGVTNDDESGLLHISHAVTNIHFLNAFYYIFPQGDDRDKAILKLPKIGLDVDEIIVDFVGGWNKLYPDSMINPNTWYMDRKMSERFKELRDNNKLNDFYLNLKPKISPNDIPFEPHCYITSRPVDKSITELWVDYNGFPRVPVYSIPMGESKVKVIKESGCDVFVDDYFENFKEINNNGILTYLYETTWNQKYDVGHLRIKNLKDLPYFR